MSDKPLSSIFRDIEAMAPRKGKHSFVEQHASHAYESVRKLFTLVEESYEPAVAEELIKRFVNAARTGDFRKFSRGTDRLKREEEDDRA